MNEIPHKGKFQFGLSYTFNCPNNNCKELIVVSFSDSLIDELSFDIAECPNCHTRYRITFQSKPETEIKQVAKYLSSSNQDIQTLRKIASQFDEILKVTVERTS